MFYFTSFVLDHHPIFIWNAISFRANKTPDTTNVQSIANSYLQATLRRVETIHTSCTHVSQRNNTTVHFTTAVHTKHREERQPGTATVAQQPGRHPTATTPPLTHYQNHNDPDDQAQNEYHLRVKWNDLLLLRKWSLVVNSIHNQHLSLVWEWNQTICYFWKMVTGSE